MFEGLFTEFDLITVDGVPVALPKSGAPVAYTGNTLSAIALQIAEAHQEETMTDTGHDPFEVDADRAIDALMIAWSDFIDEAWQDAGGQGWGAHRAGAPADEILRGSTPDALNRAIRTDWARRQEQQ